jgi:hypothetical protein
LLDFSDSSGVGFADLLGVLEASDVGFGDAFDETFFEGVGFTVLLEAAFDGFAGVTVGFGFGVGFNVSGALEDLGLVDALGFLLGFGALLFGFLDLLLGGAGSAFSPDFALLSPNEKHLETRSHSRSYVGVRCNSA